MDLEVYLWDAVYKPHEGHEVVLTYHTQRCVDVALNLHGHGEEDYDDNEMIGSIHLVSLLLRRN